MLERILPKAKSLIKDIASDGASFVDATCGNGHDTKFLAEIAGSTGHVYSFDIQQIAIDTARENTAGYENVTFIKHSHSEVNQYVGQPIRGVMFNLGYLPQGDKTITTTSQSTITALYKFFDLLEIGGRIVLVVYHGHPEGKVEKDALLAELEKWPQNAAQVLEYRFINQQNNAPFIICIEKLKELDRT